ncbi:hypothetical protein [Spiroplasma endosymbiont of Aspidapion aeneum]|uniref:hypothetical protein n=1 Tax=Spiroplasma endosymbiont of Aspidapion aeneum TaxID=3066276 RepID=UPI00313EF42E
MDKGMLFITEYFQLLDLNLKLLYIILSFVVVLIITIILYFWAIVKQAKRNKEEISLNYLGETKFLKLRKDYEIEIGKIKRIYKS